MDSFFVLERLVLLIFITVFFLIFIKVLSCGFTKGRRLIELWSKKNFGSAEDESKSNKESKKSK